MWSAEHSSSSGLRFRKSGRPYENRDVCPGSPVPVPDAAPFPVVSADPGPGSSPPTKLDTAERTRLSMPGRGVRRRCCYGRRFYSDRSCSPVSTTRSTWWIGRKMRIVYTILRLLMLKTSYLGFGACQVLDLPGHNEPSFFLPRCQILQQRPPTPVHVLGAEIR